MDKAQEENGSNILQIKMSIFKIHVSFWCPLCKVIFNTRDKFKEHQRYSLSSQSFFLVQVKVFVMHLMNAFIQCQHTGTLLNCAIQIFACQILPVTYHLSLVPTATKPYHANSTTMHSRLVLEEQKTRKVIKKLI